MAMSPQERKARTGSVQKSKSQGSPTQRNKKDPPKKVSKPTKSPVQRDRDNQKNEVAKQKLLQELNVPTTSSFSRADNVGLGSFLPSSYGDVYQGGPTNATNYGLGTNEQKNYGLGPIDQTKFLPSSYDGYQGFPESYGDVYQGKDYSDSSMGNIGKSISDVEQLGITSLSSGDNPGKVPSTGITVGSNAASTSQLVKTIEDLTTFKKGGKDEVKNIMSKVKDMEKAIDGSVQLSNYDKLQYKNQIKYAKANFAKMGYSLNDVMAAVGTNAFNKMVKKTPISRDDAAAFSTPKFNAVDAVQGIMDSYQRPAVFKGYDNEGKPTFGPMQPTIRQVGGDIARNLPDFSGLSKFTPTGMIANLFSGIGKNNNSAVQQSMNQPNAMGGKKTFGFGDIPSGANEYLTRAARGEEFTPYMAPSAPGIALANAMRSGGDGGGGQQTQNQGGNGGGGSSDADPGPLTYQTYAKPVSYNYFGGPEQIYLGGGYQQDGKTIGPFGYANGGIANFRPYGY